MTTRSTSTSEAAAERGASLGGLEDASRETAPQPAPSRVELCPACSESRLLLQHRDMLPYEIASVVDWFSDKPYCRDGVTHGPLEDEARAAEARADTIIITDRSVVAHPEAVSRVGAYASRNGVKVLSLYRLSTGAAEALRRACPDVTVRCLVTDRHHGYFPSVCPTPRGPAFLVSRLESCRVRSDFEIGLRRELLAAGPVAHVTEMAVGPLFGADSALGNLRDDTDTETLTASMSRWALSYAEQCKSANGRVAIIGVDTPLDKALWPRDITIPKFSDRITGSRLFAALSVMCPEYQILGIGPAESAQMVESAMHLCAAALGAATCACLVDPHLYSPYCDIPVARAHSAELSERADRLADRLGLPVWIADQDAPRRAAEYLEGLALRRGGQG